MQAFSCCLDGTIRQRVHWSVQEWNCYQVPWWGAPLCLSSDFYIFSRLSGKVHWIHFYLRNLKNFQQGSPCNYSRQGLMSLSPVLPCKKILQWSWVSYRPHGSALWCTDVSTKQDLCYETCDLPAWKAHQGYSCRVDFEGLVISTYIGEADTLYPSLPCAEAVWTRTHLLNGFHRLILTCSPSLL